MIEKCLSLAAGVAAIVSAAIMCLQITMLRNETQASNAQASQTIIQPCKK